MDADLTRDAQVGQRREAGRPLLHDEHTQPPMGQPPGEPPTVTTRSSVAHGPADAQVATTASEGTAVREHRPMRDQIEDEVVGRVAAGEVVASVVDHLVGADTSA